MTAAIHATHKAWIDEADLSLDDFRVQVLRTAHPADYPLASDVRSNVLVYSPATGCAADRRALQSELIRALADGPGVVVFEGAFDADVVDRASEAFFAIIDAQRAASSAAGDHFRKPGATDQIWNAAQKLALHAPQVFADYYANDALATVGYAFPTNLDRDQPIDSLAAPSQVDTVLAALADDLTAEHLDVALRDQDDRRKP
jgi:cytochrome c556